MSLTSYRAAPPRAKKKNARLQDNRAKTVGKVSKPPKCGFMKLEDQAATYSPVP